MQGSFLTRQAFAAECGISLRTLERWIDKGVVHAVQPLPGGTVRIPRSELERLEAEQLELARLRAEKQLRLAAQDSPGTPEHAQSSSRGARGPGGPASTRSRDGVPAADDAATGASTISRKRAPLAPARATSKNGEPWRPPFLDQREQHRRRKT